MGNHIGVPTTDDLEAMMTTTNCMFPRFYFRYFFFLSYKYCVLCSSDMMWLFLFTVTDVELRRLFGQLNMLTENAVTALGGPLNKMPPVTSTADTEGTDQRLVLRRIAQLLDPCKSEEDRFTVCHSFSSLNHILRFIRLCCFCLNRRNSSPLLPS